MSLGITILLYAFFVVVSENANKSTINPCAVSFLFSIGYFFVSLIFFQYFDFKKKMSDKYLIEYFIVFISMHIYGSRLVFDSISLLSIMIMIVNVLFGLFFIKKISSDCKRVPNIEKFTMGAFGEYPIRTATSLEKVKPLIWVIALIPFVSYLIWL